MATIEGDYAQGDAGKVVYLFSQVGRQQMDPLVRQYHNFFHLCLASEFITIKTLLASIAARGELTAQFLRFEDGEEP